MKTEIAISGLGVLSAAGSGVAASLRTLRDGQRPDWIVCPFAKLPVELPMFATRIDDRGVEGGIAPDDRDRKSVV